MLRRLTLAQPMETREGGDAVLVGYDGSFFVSRGPVGRALVSLMTARADVDVARQLYRSGTAAGDTAPTFEDAIGAFIRQVRDCNSKSRQHRDLWLFRRTVVPAAVANRVASWFRWLFRPGPCLAAVLVATAGLALMSFATPGLLATRRLGPPGQALLVVLALVLWHEIGHCAAARHAGAPAGGIGLGVYFVFPVMFADVRQSWTARKEGRLLVDVGGLYFQYVATGLLALWSAWNASRVGAQAVVTSGFLMLHTLNPCLKMDGYWILSDLLGCYNLRERALQPKRREESLPKWILNAYRLAVAGFFLFLVAASIPVVPGNLVRLASLLGGLAVSGWADVTGTAQRLLAAVLLLLPVVVVVVSIGSLARLVHAWVVSQGAARR